MFYVSIWFTKKKRQTTIPNCLDQGCFIMTATTMVIFSFAYKTENRPRGIIPGSDEEETMSQALPNIVQNNFQDKTWCTRGDHGKIVKTLYLQRVYSNEQQWIHNCWYKSKQRAVIYKQYDVCSSRPRIFHSFGDDTTAERLQIFTNVGHSSPMTWLSSVESLTWREDLWHPNLLPIVRQWSWHYPF